MLVVVLIAVLACGAIVFMAGFPMSNPGLALVSFLVFLLGAYLTCFGVDKVEPGDGPAAAAGYVVFVLAALFRFKVGVDQPSRRLKQWREGRRERRRESQ